MGYEQKLSTPHDTGNVSSSYPPENRAYLVPAFQTTLPGNKRKISNNQCKSFGSYASLRAILEYFSNFCATAVLVHSKLGSLGLLALTTLGDNGEIKTPIEIKIVYGGTERASTLLSGCQKKLSFCRWNSLFSTFVAHL